MLAVEAGLAAGGDPMSNATRCRAAKRARRARHAMADLDDTRMFFGPLDVAREP